MNCSGITQNLKCEQAEKSGICGLTTSALSCQEYLRYDPCKCFREFFKGQLPILCLAIILLVKKPPQQHIAHNSMLRCSDFVLYDVLWWIQSNLHYISLCSQCWKLRSQSGIEKDEAFQPTVSCTDIIFTFGFGFPSTFLLMGI